LEYDTFLKSEISDFKGEENETLMLNTKKRIYKL